MRITNKIMQRNNLANINTNKIYQDKLTSQMSTQKKINRPSDDPVVAIRALRLRGNVTEISQYYDKNIPDAESWLEVTESALKNLSEVVTDMISQCTKGSNGDLTVSDREIIVEQLKALADEVYSTGDVDYAGRYVFTGYRTDTSLSFMKEAKTAYTITEQLDNSAIDKVTKVDSGNLLELNANNYDTTYAGINESQISSVDVYRIRLAYNDCSDNATPSVSIKQKQADGSYKDTELWSAAAGSITTVHSYETPSPYVKAAEEDNAVIYVPETGELLLGKNSYEKLMAVKDDPATIADESEIRVTYQKDEWATGDLRPEHYFYCTAVDNETGETIEYNPDYLTPNAEKQVIEYDVGFNQTIQVNSTADECFKHAIGREIDDLVESMQNVIDLEKIKTNLQKWQETATGAAAETVAAQLDAADKALTLAKDKTQKLFEAGITAFQGHLDATNLSITNCGTRSSKLELISNRMQNQKTTFETLKSENEDADITEVAIQLNSAELTYEAALMATGKVMQTTLLDFI